LPASPDSNSCAVSISTETALGKTYVYLRTAVALHWAYGTRVRDVIAIIPLLLHRPDFAADVPEALSSSSGGARLYLMCYYTAARYLQLRYRAELARLAEPGVPLPDLFSVELGLEVEPVPIAEFVPVPGLLALCW